MNIIFFEISRLEIGRLEMWSSLYYTFFDHFYSRLDFYIGNQARKAL